MVKFLSILYSKTPEIKDAQGNIKPISVASLEKIDISIT
jgi:hypothetical protein